MSLTTNAFWREVLDYLPGLVMLFRIDENEQTHLMFVSEHVKDDLGFSPEEYVLASEQQSVVFEDLERLIDAIATLSHETDAAIRAECRLTDRSGERHEYEFDFRLFRTKSSKNNLISVALYPAGTRLEVAASQVMAAVSGPLFVAKSPMMQDILTRMDGFAAQDLHILFRGDRGVGKRTLASMLAKKSAVLTANQQVWELDLSEVSSSQVGRLFAGIDESDTTETLLDDIRKELQLVIFELGLLRGADQRDLLRLIENRTKKGLRTRVIATSTASIEKLIESGSFDAQLFYKLSFVTVFVPPVKVRVEDVEEISRQMVRRIAQALQMAEPEVTSKSMQQLLALPLPNNFSDVLRVLRRSVLLSEGHLQISDTVQNAQVGTDSGELLARKSARGSGGQKASNSNDLEQLPMLQSGNGFKVLPYEEATRRYLEAVLAHTEGKIYGSDGAAALLRMKPTTLQSKLKKLKIR